MKKFAQRRLKSMVVIMMALLFSLPVYSTDRGKPEQMDSLMNHCHQNEQFSGTVLVAENGKVIYKKDFVLKNFKKALELYPYKGRSWYKKISTEIEKLTEKK